MRKQRLFLTAGAVCAVISAIIFLYNNIIIPKVRLDTESKIRAELDDKVMLKAKVAVVAEGKDIPKYTVLSDEIINTKIKLVDIPVKYTAKNAAVDLDLIRGKVTKEDMSSGEQILLDNLSVENKWFGEYERLKEYCVGSIVAGEVKTGNIIDIVLSYGDGSYDVVVPKIKIKKLIDEAEAAEANSAAKQAQKKDSYTLIVAVDEEQYRDLELAGLMGKLQTRLYIDESQPASKKTFDYASALTKLKAKSRAASDDVAIKKGY